MGYGTRMPACESGLKEADRALKREFGRGDLTQGDSYDSLKERICEQLYKADKAEERVVQRRIESLTANVRREVEQELAAERAELQNREDQAAEREEAVTGREKKHPPPTAQGSSQQERS